MVLMARRRNTSEMTGWGYYLSALLKDRHFDNLRQFAGEIEAHDRSITPQMISKYRRGKAPLWFVADAITVLELTDDESEKFVRLWLETLPEDERAVHEKMASLLLRGSGNPAVTQENREQARKFVEEIEGNEKQRGEGQDGAGNP